MDFFKPVPAAMPTIGVLIFLYCCWGTGFFWIVLFACVVCAVGSSK